MDSKPKAFPSRRSPVFSTHGMVASSQPLATQIGIRILQQGGNAADAAVAVAAALNVTEPGSTGIGGDCFCLFWDAKEKKVKSMNASGRAPKAMTLSKLESMGINASNPWLHTSPLTVTVPGAAAGWVDCISNFGSGKLTLQQILDPAIDLADNGFPVNVVSASAWANSVQLLSTQPNGREILLDAQRSPAAGEIMKNKGLARTFRKLAEEGKKGFYEGEVASALIEVLTAAGGLMSLEDLQDHRTTFEDPIHVNYRGVDVYEVPPNGQGIQALMALNLLEGFDVKQHAYGSPEHMHLLIECMRVAFSDGRHFVADPSHVKVPITGLIDKKYAESRRALIQPDKANQNITHGHPEADSGTVYFNVVDGQGNACSFINSNYMGFGTGIIPKGFGFTLQNRGFNFSLDAGHYNVVAPGKRPFHTIIPGMMTKDGELFGPFGVMGGFMQGHLQVVSNIVDWGMNPQEAIDAPRFLITDGTQNGQIIIETGVPIETVQKLRQMGHNCEVQTISPFENLPGHFGTSQVILRNPTTGVLCGGSDGRNDGHAAGF